MLIPPIQRYKNNNYTQTLACIKTDPMTFIDRLTDFITNYYKIGLDKNGFRINSEINGPGMGSGIDYQKDDLIIQFVNDRDQYFVSIANKNKVKTKWDLDLIMAYFYLNGLCDFDSNKIDRKEILLKRCNWKNYRQLSRFLFDNIDKVSKLITEFENNSFYHDLIKLRKERGKYIWE